MKPEQKSFMQLLNDAPSYLIQRDGHSLGSKQIYASTIAIAMWHDPEVESALRGMDINDSLTFTRDNAFGECQAKFHVIRVQ